MVAQPGVPATQAAAAAATKKLEELQATEAALRAQVQEAAEIQTAGRELSGSGIIGIKVLAGLSPRAFKALRPASADQAEDEADHFAPFGAPDGPQLMVDAYDPNHYGGTGKKADWNVAAAIAQRVPRLLLAGGLTPANVADAVRTVRPWGVDVSSGVEISPGRKDHDAVRAFITAAKGALS